MKYCPLITASFFTFSLSALECKVANADNDLCSETAWTNEFSQQKYAYRQNYLQFLGEISSARTELSCLLEKANTPKEKKEILKLGRDYLFDVITTGIIPAWEGTPWNFDGAADLPGKYPIACGLFVTTILNHAQFNIDRIVMGQLHSGNIILNFTDHHRLVKLYHGDKGMKKLKKDIAGTKGIYIIGLDNHTGFIWSDGIHEPIFSHSSNEVKHVILEPLEGNAAIASSRYRILGELLDDNMIEQWIYGKEFPVKYSTTWQYQQKIQRMKIEQKDRELSKKD